MPQVTERYLPEGTLNSLFYSKTESSLLWFSFYLNHSAKKLLKIEETSLE